MATVTVNKKGKIIVIDDKKKSHSTPYRVSPGDSDSKIKSAVDKAIGMHMGKPGVISLMGKGNKYVGKIKKQLQKKPKKKETPKEKKGEKKKGKKKAKPEKKKVKAKKKKEEKAEESVPKKKTITVSISATVLNNVLNLLKKNKDKKLRKELQKLAESYATLKEYVSKNADAVTRELLNLIPADDFILYLNEMALQDPEMGKLLGHFYENNGLAKNAKSDLLGLANNALRGYVSSKVEENDKLAEEVEAVGGIGKKGTMDTELFFASVLFVRRSNNSGAPLLTLELVEKVPEIEKPKVEQPKIEKKTDWVKESQMIATNIAKGNVEETSLPENLPAGKLVDPLFIEFNSDTEYRDFVKSYKHGKKKKKVFAGLATPTVSLETNKAQNLFVKSLQAYIEHQINLNDKFKQDLEAAELPTEIKKDGNINQDLLKTLSMLKWREKNPTAPVWGTKVEKKKEEPEKKKWKYNF